MGARKRRGRGGLTYAAGADAQVSTQTERPGDAVIITTRRRRDCDRVRLTNANDCGRISVLAFALTRLGRGGTIIRTVCTIGVCSRVVFL